MQAKESYALKVVVAALILFAITTFFAACGRATYRVVDNRTPVLTAPASLQQCAYGGTVVTVSSSRSIICNGAPGSDGADGVDGSNGTNGSNGQNGAPGTSVTVVNLCPGSTHYSNVFVEVALCISNKLYGVYSANGGFLTYLPPGAYSSNAIGSACNLIVGSNCSVSH